MTTTFGRTPVVLCIVIASFVLQACTVYWDHDEYQTPGEAARAHHGRYHDRIDYRFEGYKSRVLVTSEQLKRCTYNPSYIGWVKRGDSWIRAFVCREGFDQPFVVTLRDFFPDEDDLVKCGGLRPRSQPKSLRIPQYTRCRVIEDALTTEERYRDRRRHGGRHW